MLGVPLFASFRRTKQNSGEELKEKLRNKTGPWLSKKMPLIQRSFSVNCYLLPKVWFRCHIVPLRKGDSDNFKKVVNRFLFADQLEKPQDLLKYRSRCKGGLQLHNIDCKAIAMLIKTFLEMSISSKFRTSLYFNALYEFYVLDNTAISPPRCPPFYNQQFFDIIKSAREENQIVEWSSKQWYCYLLERNYLQKEVLDGDGRSCWEDIKCKVETVFPNFDWEATWAHARLPGLNNECRSFLWLYFHNLLPTQARLHRILRTIENPNCTHCDSDEIDHIWNHTFITCSYSKHIVDWMLSRINRLQTLNVNLDAALLLQFPLPITEIDLLCATWLVAETLAYIWARRKNRGEVSIASLLAILKIKAVHLSHTENHSHAGQQLCAILDGAA